MKRYNLQYITKGSCDGEPLEVILSEHCFLLMALWTAYKLLSRQSKIKVVKINKYSRNFFKLEKL